MAIVLGVCLFTFFKQKDHLKSENRLESLVSRESSFLFNNLILLTACFTVLWGTLFPVLSEYVQGSKVTVGAPFYNRVNLPIGLFLLFLTGIGPLLAWRSTSLRSIRRNFVMPGIAMAVAFAVCIIAGVRPWSAGDDAQAQAFSLITFTLAAGVITAIFTEFLRGAGVVRTQTGKNLFSSTVLLVRRNTRRYGGYIVHFGIVVMFIGIAGGAFNQSREQEMGFNDTMEIGGYKIVCQSFTQDSNPNYDTEYSLLDVFRNGKKLTQLAPERRFYIASQTTSTMVALRSTLVEDLYVIYMGKNPETDKPIIKVFINPLVNWIWIGVLIVVLGTFLALVPALNRSAVRAAVEDTAPAIGEPEVHHA
jgi:cytochrome c-type biogenesis protein CcmF